MALSQFSCSNTTSSLLFLHDLKWNPFQLAVSGIRAQTLHHTVVQGQVQCGFFLYFLNLKKKFFYNVVQISAVQQSISAI